jgi:hypothetical protein
MILIILHIIYRVGITNTEFEFARGAGELPSRNHRAAVMYDSFTFTDTIVLT